MPEIKQKVMQQEIKSMHDFTKFKDAVARQFGEMRKHKLFCTDVGRDEMWDAYLDAFPEGTNPMYRARTEHDCSCCRQFIRTMGNVVAIKDDGNVVSIWDGVVDDDAYDAVARRMAALVRGRPIRDAFLHYERSVGTDKNYEETPVGTPNVTWRHFHVALPQSNNLENCCVPMKFDILNRFSGKVQFTAEIECSDDALPSIKLGLAVKAAIKSRANLSGANLSGANLSGANLSGANLSRADLSGAYLSGANLSRADLSGANLSRADLSRADLSGANLSGANLSRAYLSRAYLSRAYLRDADLSSANLIGADLRDADLSSADLRDADLSGADLSGADLSGQWIIQGATRSDGYAFFLQKLNDDKEPMVKAGCCYFTLSQAQAHWTQTRDGTALGRETESIVQGMVGLALIRGLMLPNDGRPKT